MAGLFCSVFRVSFVAGSLQQLTRDFRDIKASGRNEEQRIFWEFQRKRGTQNGLFF
jgi:hypothetical protein